jgi:lipopolysaccharide export system permease protein
LVRELDDVGEGYYRAVDAFIFVGLTLPRRFLDMTALSYLLGSIIGLGTLANSNEILAMRAVGISVRRIAWSVLRTGAFLMAGIILMAQFVVPPLEQHARTRRELALSGAGTMLPSSGFWTRDGSRFIKVGSTSNGGLLADIGIYEFDKKGSLQSYIYARTAEINEGDRWVLTGVKQKTVTKQGFVTRELPSMELDSFLSAKQVSILGMPPDTLSPFELYHYVRALQERGQNADRYALAFWQKLTMPLKAGAMILLALPFVVGSAREASAGVRVTLGSVVGIAYYYFDQVLGYLGLLLDLHPTITCLTPVIVFTTLALYLLRRAL